MPKLTLGTDPRAEIARERDGVSEERLRVAWHEAGHAVMAGSLGYTLRAVSIKPRLRWRGVCFQEQEEFSAEVLDGLNTGPLATQPVELRVRFEGSILILLAGPAAEDVFYLLRGFTGYRGVDERDRVSALGAVRKLALSSEELDLLASGDRPETVTESDYSRALTTARALVGEEEAHRFVAWLEASARRIVRTPEVLRRIEALAEALVEHEEISGKAATEIIKNACHYHEGAR